MAMTVGRGASTAVLLGMLAVWPTGLESCMGPLLQALFTPSIDPSDVDRFAGGDLGILEPFYRRKYLLLAYRYLNEQPVTAEQRSALFPKPVEGPAADQNPVQAWLQARSAVAGTPPVKYGFINVYRSEPAANSFYLNCNDDAFATATETLKARVAKYGSSSDQVKQWLAAQDMVFQNCSGGPAIPAPLPPASDPLARADRDYQVAAAHFYSAQFEKARAEFEAIGNDPASPWNSLGPYLAARALIRAGALPEAEKQLASIAGERAQRLLKTVRARLHPVETMAALGRGIAAKDPQDLANLVAGYTWMYDVLTNRAAEIEKVAAIDDLTDWIGTFQGSMSFPVGHAYENWRAKRTTTWLVAALAAPPPGEAQQSELVRAAGELAADSPGYLSAQYYAALQLERTSKNSEAKSRLDQLLHIKQPRDVRNLLLAARMKLATTWDAFLRDAVRTPAGEEGYDYAPAGGAKRYDPNAPALDADSVYLFRNEIPLELLAAAATGPKLPNSIRRNLVLATWTRAVLLNRMDTARELSPEVAELAPTVRPEMNSFRTATGEASKFAAAFVMLRNPGMNPDTRDGFGRVTPIDRVESFRDNWWCSEKRYVPDPTNPLRMPRPAVHFSAALRQIYGPAWPEARFLTQAQRAAAASERAELWEVPTGPDFLAQESLKWATAHPDDPRVPEALHLVVRATRYGCVDVETPDYSKRAFTLLHKQYPRSEWAKKTPYWY